MHTTDYLDHQFKYIKSRLDTHIIKMKFIFFFYSNFYLKIFIIDKKVYKKYILIKLNYIKLLYYYLLSIIFVYLLISIIDT